jgi:hypothetical protein
MFYKLRIFNENIEGYRVVRGDKRNDGSRLRWILVGLQCESASAYQQNRYRWV